MSVGFIEKEFVTMHGHSNIKKMYEVYRIVNLVVVVSIYRADMPHFRQTLPDTEINNLYVFSWFPNVSYGGHDNVRDATCSDTWLVGGQSHLVNRGNLFPEKIPIGLQDLPFKQSGYFTDVRTQSHLHSRADNERKANFSILEIDFIKLVQIIVNHTH